MRLTLKTECDECENGLLKQHQVRGLCESCWKFSSQKKADITAGELRTELGSFSPLLCSLMAIHPEKKIARIKEVRSATGLNLKHAKSVMDQVNFDVPSFKDTKTWEEVKKLREDAWEDKALIRVLEGRLEQGAIANADIPKNREELVRLRHLSQNLEARLGASQRELLELRTFVDKTQTGLRAAEQVADALHSMTADASSPVKALTVALGTLIEDVLAVDLSDLSF